MANILPYLAITRATFMTGLVYKYGFLVTILSNIIYIIVAYAFWNSIYANAVTLHGMTFNEAFLYMALASAFFVLLRGFVDSLIFDNIRDGSIISYLTKPVDYQFYLLFFSLGWVGLTLIINTIPTVGILVFIFHFPIEIGPGLLFFPLSLILAFLINFNFDYCIGMLGFYSESTWGITMTKEIVISFLAGVLIPLQFFPDEIRKILLALPFQAIYYTPITLITRPNQSWDSVLFMIAVQVFWLIVTFILSRLFYNHAIKILRIAGG